jgi:hypothetical protein
MGVSTHSLFEANEGFCECRRVSCFNARSLCTNSQACLAYGFYACCCPYDPDADSLQTARVPPACYQNYPHETPETQLPDYKASQAQCHPSSSLHHRPRPPRKRSLHQHLRRLENSQVHSHGSRGIAPARSPSLHRRPLPQQSGGIPAPPLQQ